MSKRIFRVLFSTIWLSIVGISASAQSEPPKFELGVQVTASPATVPVGSPVFILGSGLQSIFYRPTTTTADVGGGVRIGYNFNKWLAAEGEFNYFPRDLGSQSSGDVSHDRIQSVFGIKAGRRFKNFGLFAKARPGFMINHRTSYPFSCQYPTLIACVPVAPYRRSATVFMTDLGGVFEVYTSRRTFIRFDVGDAIFYNGRAGHRLQISSGFGFRF